jgi:putative tricarboxylic transport membrane protein
MFVLFAAYGLQATTIPMFPGQEFEPFKPRTMPVLLAVTGLLLCVIRVLQLMRSPQQESTSILSGFDWKPASLLCVTMLIYGFAINPLGFVLATTLFLAAGFFILGERRARMLLGLSFVFSLAFYFLMTRALGLYLSPGPWWGI